MKPNLWNHQIKESSLEQESEEMDDTLRTFREALRAASEKPVSFWTKQRAGITEKLQRPVPAWARRRRLIWVPASLILLLCLTFFAERAKAPVPDIAGGSDQDLLIEVERALNREYPEALSPAVISNREIDRIIKNSGPALAP
jgi:hypothetical protein